MNTFKLKVVEGYSLNDADDFAFGSTASLQASGTPAETAKKLQQLKERRIQQVVDGGRFVLRCLIAPEQSDLLKRLIIDHFVTRPLVEGEATGLPFSVTVAGLPLDLNKLQDTTIIDTVGIFIDSFDLQSISRSTGIMPSIDDERAIVQTLIGCEIMFNLIPVAVGQEYKGNKKTKKAVLGLFNFRVISRIDMNVLAAFNTRYKSVQFNHLVNATMLNELAKMDEVSQAAKIKSLAATVND